MSTRQLLPLIGALFALYIIWGSTYFAIAVGVASWPPLMMAGVRFLSAGAVLLAWLLATGHKLPSRKPLLNAALIGVLLLAVGNGFVTLAEHQHVPSGIAAVMVATVPLFTLCFSRFFGIATRKLEWLGIAIGLAGIVLLIVFRNRRILAGCGLKQVMAANVERVAAMNPLSKFEPSEKKDHHKKETHHKEHKAP